MVQNESVPRYIDTDQMVVSAARQIRDSDVVYTGVGLPMLAALQAKHTHAPNCTIVIQNGIIRASLFPHPGATDTLGSQALADQLDGLFYVNCLGQAGFISTGFLGAGQIDRYGNVNDTAAGDYRNPVHRWAGSGGGNDVMSFCDRTIIIVRQSRRRFLEKVDFITCPGYLDGRPGQREEIGLRPNTGPSVVITNLGIYTFEDQEMTLKSIHGDVGVTPEQVKAEVSWDLKVADQLEDTLPPTDEELRVFRETVSPGKVWVGGRRAVAVNKESN
ncbi:CoA-transferase subunit beta [Chloroflexota bacterium]